MPESEFTADEVVNYVSAAILSGPDDDIWDVIFDWVMTGAQKVIDAIVDWFWGIWGSLKTQLSSLWHLITDPISTVVSYIWSKVQSVWTWVYNTYSKLADWVSSAYSVVSSAVVSALTRVKDWIEAIEDNIWNWITAKAGEIISSITTTFSKLSSSITTWFTTQWNNISNLFSTWGTNITTWFSNLGKTIAGFFTDLWTKLEATWTWLTTWMTNNIVKPMDAWWDGFLAKIFDFGAWVGKLMDVVGDWFMVDIPGSSPRWIGIFKAIGNFFATWFYEFPKYFFSDFPERVAYGLGESWAWLTGSLAPFVDAFLTSVTSIVQSAGPISPGMGKDWGKTLTSVGLTAVVGLFGMTVAGELLHPLKNLGLGNLAAIIFDLTNYKMLTGAFVTALAVAAVRTPLTYYYNDLFRPNLPKLREASDFYARDQLTMPEFSRLLAYQGIADIYHAKYADVAYRAVSLYPLSSLANTGIFDEALFKDNLRDLGLKPEWRPLLLEMYRSKSMENVKGMMSSVAVTRFKEGFTDESQFTSELKLLGYEDKQIPVYIASAKLAYATDYITDLKAAYTTAVGKGLISLQEYRSALGDLGIVPERVEAFVIRAQATLNPKVKLTPVALPTPVYQTDAGSLEVDTLRRRRRKNLITRDEEIAGLLDLGTGVSLATAYADNDDARLAEKETAE